MGWRRTWTACPTAQSPPGRDGGQGCCPSGKLWELLPVLRACGVLLSWAGVGGECCGHMLYATLLCEGLRCACATWGAGGA